MRFNVIILATMLSGLSATSFAQRPARTSMHLKAAPMGATPVVFNPATDISQCAIPAAPVEWGMDQAWIWDAIVKRGTNFIGKDILSQGVARVSFQPSDLVDASGNLSSSQQSYLQTRLNNIALSGVKNLVLNCDHEVLMNKESYPNCAQNYANYNGKPAEWHRVIKASVQYCRSKGFNVVAVSPFNEPDFSDWKEGTQAEFKEIARLITEDPDLAGIRICAGNTLNCDQALSWYNAVKPYVSEANTHQLAGSFDNYARFWQTASADGVRTTGDELHNTMEAFVGIHYGMQAGIWWGYDALTRGEFCKQSFAGKEIGYAEHRSSWTAAAVYKRPDAASSNGFRTDAFIGGSERQANDHSFELQATNRPTFFDGNGPTYSYSIDYPGGTGYSKGQSNAERLVQIHQGEDVPLEPITRDTYYIMNANSGMCLSFPSRTIANGKQLQQYTIADKYKDQQQWKVSHIDSRYGGDYTYFWLKNSKDSTCMVDVLNGSTKAEGAIIGYYGGGGDVEQWSAEYAGNGNWYLRSRCSGLYLEVRNASTKSGNNGLVQQNTFSGGLHQQWRFVPASCTKLDIVAPAAPTGLSATLQPGAVALRWEKSADSDLAGYVVLRSYDGEQWDMIGRMVEGTEFLDNEAFHGAACMYKVKAVDICRNQSEPSAIVTVDMSAAQGKGLVARYTFDDTADDASSSCLDGVIGGTATSNFSTTKKEGTKAFYFRGDASVTMKTPNYLQLPAGVVNSDELTITAWVSRNTYLANNTRLFEFSSDTDKGLYLIPTTGSNMRFIMKSGAAEEVISTTSLPTGWHHVAVTIGPEKVTLYVDGTEKGSSTAKSVRPSDIRPVFNYVGKSQAEGSNLFRGYLDDMRIYSYELTADDITSVMNGGAPAPFAPASLKGDVNGDGLVTMSDANMVVNAYLGLAVEGFNPAAADVDGDGQITMADANAIVNIYLGNS